MALYSIPKDQIDEENKRLKVLDSYGILDTLPEKEFDDITKLASFICDTEVSLVALMDRDRNWYKSKHGPVTFDEMNRTDSFCHYTIKGNDIYEIPDTTQDPKFSDSNIVVGDPHVRYYAGYPLINTQGYKLGTLCIVDFVPRKLSLMQRTALRTLANQVMINFELRRQKSKLESEKRKISKSNRRLKLFGRVISHDLKQPLNNAKALYKMYSSQKGDRIELGEKIDLCFTRMTSLIDGILTFAESDSDRTQKEETDLSSMVNEIIQILSVNKEIKFETDIDTPVIRTEKILLHQVLQNLICNAIKFNDKGKNGLVSITAFQKNDKINIQVQDNGPGIPKKYHNTIFEPFKRLVSRQEIEGNGLGLATVAQIIQEKQGSIWINSEVEKGAIFSIEWTP